MKFAIIACLIFAVKGFGQDPVQPLTPAKQTASEQYSQHLGYLSRLGTGFDVFLNEITGGNNDETLSSRMARWDRRPSGFRHRLGRLICKGLNLHEKNHGAIAEADDLGRAKKVEEIECRTGNLPTCNGKP